MTCASIAVTLDRYRHLHEGIDDDLAKRLEQAQAQVDRLVSRCVV
jgi:hypothetical protein